MNILSWSNEVNLERAELVFEKRNKAYGGYIIRRDYTNRLLLALLITVVSLGVSVIIPGFKPAAPAVVNIVPSKIDGVIIIMDPPPPLILPTVNTPIQAKQVNTEILTIPKVIELSPAENTLSTADELNKTAVGTEKTEGSNLVPVASVSNPGPVTATKGPVSFAHVMPVFIGGESKLFEYLQKHIKYPPPAREAGIEGKVYVTFVVDVDGKIINAKVLRGIGGGCDQEALRVISGMPQWKPGFQNGEAVQVQYNIPVNFSLKRN
ncbi:MAG TPA: TonB family protein [Bacteroidia bacterium]|nr:TonB family protein [Bacteroidia bacterium]